MLVFISAAREDQSAPANAAAHLRLGATLRHVYGKYAVRDVSGAYKGIPESSWVVDTDEIPQGHDLVEELETVAYLLGQDSILVVHTDTSRAAVLRFTNDLEQIEAGENFTYLGEWTKVSRSEALEHDGYSNIDGEYWVAV